MNDETFNAPSPEEKAVAQRLAAISEEMQPSPVFQKELASRLVRAHGERNQSPRAWPLRLLPSVGWAVFAIFAIVVVAWGASSLSSNESSAAEATPTLPVAFDEAVQSGEVCTGPLVVGHGASVFVTNPEKNGFIALDEEENIGELRAFQWSYDGESLAAAGVTRGSGDLYLLNAETNQLEPVTTGAGLAYLNGVAWSHDGEQLLTWEIRNNSQIILFDLARNQVTKLDLPVQFIETPRFAPDDESILFLGATRSSAGLFRVSLTDLEPHLISAQVEDDRSFAWSPDGSRLAYVEMDRNLGEARLILEDSAEKVTIGSLPVPKGLGSSLPSAANLSWSADGKSLIFDFGRQAASRLVYLAHADGSGLVTLAESAHAPALSPDGRCLAYIHDEQVFLIDVHAAVSSAYLSASAMLVAEIPAGRGRSNIESDWLQWQPAAETISSP
ncbi:MAG TPA: hypothetical protein VFF68_01235 [Anaerolineaceae bacterium]|nr:hypothetical protein [Anaerolineaceae bacterium]